jgi:multidrug efflux system outer membrane protein
MFRKEIASLFALLTISVSGCTFGPDYTRPEMELPATWRTATEAKGALGAELFWKSFGDATLDQLIDTAIENNLDVQLAAARVRGVYARYGITRSEIFPEIRGGASYSRERLAQFSGIPGLDPVQDAFDSRLTLGWEVDVWGRIRRSIEAASNDILAEEEVRRGVLATVVATVARLYVELTDLTNRLTLTHQTLDSRHESVRIARERFNQGTVSELDLQQALSEEASVEAQVPVLEIQIAERQHLLSVLLGKVPGPIILGSWKLASSGNLTVPPAVPSEILQYRPDIVRAEKDLAAATARIGAARALFFPRFSLTGLTGFASPEFSEWLDSSSEQWRITPGLDLPIFNAGRIASQVELAEAIRDGALAEYKRVVLSSLSEVENALIGFAKAKVQASTVERQTQALEKYLQLSLQRYEEGQSSYLEVLDAQRNLFAAELNLSGIRANAASRFIEVFRAFGGKWIDVASEQVKPQP